MKRIIVIIIVFLLTGLSGCINQSGNIQYDEDNLPDNWEMEYFGNLSYSDFDDPDNDNLTNLEEYQNGTNPTKFSTVNDNISDGWKVDYGLDPLDKELAGKDLDNDALTTLQEYQNGTNPNLEDTDGDGYSDKDELIIVPGVGPLNPTFDFSEESLDLILNCYEYQKDGIDDFEFQYLTLLYNISKRNSDAPSVLLTTNMLAEDKNITLEEINLISTASILAELEDDLYRMPEVYSKEVPQDEIKEYISLINQIQNENEDAARWVIQTGLFIEDKNITDLEKRFVNESISRVSSEDLLRFYVSQAVMDGITKNDLGESVNFVKDGIKVDGDLSDWQNLDFVLDLEGDADPASDIIWYSVSIDDENIYIAAKFSENPSEDDVYLFCFDIDGDGQRDFHTNFDITGRIDIFKDKPENSKIPSSDSKIISKGNIVEAKIPREVFPETKTYSSYFLNFQKDCTRQITIHESTSDLISEFNPNKSQNLSYLADDILDLPEIKDGIDLQESDAINKLKKLINASLDDYELRKGICLIDEYGVPNTRLFSINVPDYNTQLESLFWLLEDNNVPKDYYKVALAICIDYGSVITIGDNDVDKKVREYQSKILEFVMETDKLIKEQGLANWQASEYPLEADLGLIWGANANLYPWEAGTEENQPSWFHTFSEIKRSLMNQEDFDWLFASNKTMEEIRGWMISKGFVNLTVEDSTIVRGIEDDVEYSGLSKAELKALYNEDVDELARKLNDYFFVPPFGPSQGGHFQQSASGVFTKEEFENRSLIWDVEGKIIYPGDIPNPDWQWQKFREESVIYGCCVDDVLIESLAFRSINRPALMGIYPHAINLYWNHMDRLWKGTLIQAYSPTGEIRGYGYGGLPFDNFVRNTSPQFGNYFLKIESKKAFVVGIPLGYFFRIIPRDYFY